MIHGIRLLGLRPAIIVVTRGRIREFVHKIYTWDFDLIGELIAYLLKWGRLKWRFISKFNFRPPRLSNWCLPQIHKATWTRASRWCRLLGLIINSLDLLKVSSFIRSQLVTITSLSCELVSCLRFEHEKLLQIWSLLLYLLYIAISICLTHHSTLRWTAAHTVIYELIVHVWRVIRVLIVDCTS